MKRRVFTILFVAVFASGCATDLGKQPAHIVTERDARLISIARQAAALEGFSLADAIYQVRRDGDGWIVTRPLVTQGLASPRSSLTARFT